MKSRHISGGPLFFHATSHPAHIHIENVSSNAIHRHPDMNEFARIEFLNAPVPGQNYSVSAYVNRGQTRAR